MSRADRYRGKAAEIRAALEVMTDSEAKTELAQVAEDYLQMAQVLEGRQGRQPLLRTAE